MMVEMEEKMRVISSYLVALESFINYAVRGMSPVEEMAFRSTVADQINKYIGGKNE